MSATCWTLRPAEEGDLDALHALSREAGWPHRVEDWRFLMQLGHGTVAADEDGRIGGSAAWWPLGEAAASVGMIIVAPALQGRGLGNSLMARVFAETGGRRLHLNATAAGRRLYERSGFVPAGTLRQHQGIATPAPTAARTERVRAMGQADRAAVAALDLAATGTGRTALLDALAAAGTGHVHREGGRVTGYAFTRPFGRGTVLGPMVAEDEGAALALAAAAIVGCSGTFLRADTPIAEGPFRDALLASNLPEVSSGLPMVRGVPAAAPGPARIYCVAAQALG